MQNTSCRNRVVTKLDSECVPILCAWRSNVIETWRQEQNCNFIALVQVSPRAPHVYVRESRATNKESYVIYVIYAYDDIWLKGHSVNYSRSCAQKIDEK